MWSSAVKANDYVDVNSINNAAVKNVSAIADGNNSSSVPQTVPDELIVKFKNKLKTNSSGKINPQDTGTPSIDIRNKSKKVASIDQIFAEGRNFESVSSDVAEKGLDRIYRMKFSNQADVTSLVQSYKQDSNVEYAQPNYVYHIANTTPNDPLLSTQYALTKIKAFQAWDTTTGSSSVIVAVVDTGVDYTHQELTANIWTNPGETGMTQSGDRCWTGSPQDKSTNNCDDDNDGFVDDWRGWNYADGNNDPMDTGSGGVYHGTHVSGIIDAVGNNGIGIAGVTWNSKIMPLKIFASNGDATTYDGALAIRYAADHGARVINNSWGAQNVYDYYLEDAIDYAHDKGAVVVNAAGNNSSDVYNFSPANIASGLAVSATDATDNFAGFSNWGAKIDVSAPGDSINSTYPTNSYQIMSGTSMAAPYVSGLAALILAHNPALSSDEVRQVIKSSADDLGTSGPDVYFGTGRIDAYSAMQATNPLTAYISSPVSPGLDLNGTVSIVGSASGTNFQSYKLEYGSGTNPTSWTQIATATIPVSNGTLATLNLQQLKSGTYVLRLTAINTGGKQYQFSSYLDVLTTPSVPASFNFANANSNINLTWKDSSSQFPIAGYQIYRSESSDFSSQTIFTTISTSYTDSSVQVGHIYYYKVRAYDNQSPASYSDFSNVLTVVNGSPWWLHQISTKTGGAQKSGFTDFISVPSDDGNYEAFADNSSDLVSGDTNGKYDIFMKNMLANTTTRISVSTQGVESNCDSNYPVMSSDGRYVAFQSCATNLVANDTNGKPDIFVHDMQLGTTTLVSSDTDGVQASTWTGGTYPAISADGRYVTFTASENNGYDNIYRKDLQTGITQLVSSTLTGVKGNRESLDSGISSDGRYVVFDTQATNLTAGGGSGTYLKDMQTNAIEYISIGNDAGLWAGFGVEPHVSDSGRYVVFQSGGTHLVSGLTTDGRNNLYLRDRQNGTTQLITTAYTGGDYNGYAGYGGNISSDGRYIAFYSDGSNLVAGDNNGLWDAFIFDTSNNKMSLVSSDLFGSESYSGGVMRSAELSHNGKFISFVSRAQGLVPSAPNSGSLMEAYIRTTDDSPGPFDHIAISPSSDQRIQMGQTIQFAAFGQDEYGSNISGLTYTWTAADQNGFFSNSNPGTYQVSVSSGGKSSATVNVTVIPAVLDHINISPSATQTIPAGGRIQFSAQGQDANGNNIPGIIYDWENADSTGLFSETAAGNYPVTVSAGDISATVDVIVTPLALDYVYTYPAGDLTITAGDSVNFIAQGQDVYRSDIPDLSYSWTGTDQNGLFDQTTAGTYQIKATSGGIDADVVNITVLPAALNHINISPNIPQIIMAGQNVQFAAFGQDQYGNNISGLTYAWSGTDQSGLFSEITPGIYTASVSVGSVQSQAVSITVPDYPPATPVQLLVQ